MEAWEKLEKRIKEILQLLEHVREENSSLKNENKDIKQKYSEQQAHFEKSLADGLEKVKQLELQMQASQSEIVKNKEELQKLQSDRKELQKVKEVTLLKVQEMISYLDKVTAER